MRMSQTSQMQRHSYNGKRDQHTTFYSPFELLDRELSVAESRLMQTSYARVQCTYVSLLADGRGGAAIGRQRGE